MIDIDKIIADKFREGKYYQFVICEFNDNLVLVPCEEHTSGNYPNYEQAVILAKNVNLTKKLEYVEGIMYDVMSREVHLVGDSWDGFYINEEISMNQFFEFVNEIYNILLNNCTEYI